MEEIPKPSELLAARTAAEQLFALLRRWFDVPESVQLDLTAVDSAVAELGDPQLVMAMAMRKLQALHLITTPGVRTTTDVVLTVIQDLERALLQAPGMHLRQSAAETDWDAEFRAMGSGGAGQSDDDLLANLAAGDPDAGSDAGNPDASGDDEIETFRRHHLALHEAARAVLHITNGEIRVLI
jgi:hypothetical protein